ncbi:hypothetical protein IMSAG049_00213 [Clostridiales bacterium]|nr:hypothetical protein IMSAG049_00213 [Clostridiales bacterium]
MRIVVDADACPVKDIILETAAKYKIPVTMVADTSHILSNIECEIIVVDKGQDAADIAIANRIHKDDIAVTQDSALACMLLSKGANVINQNGFLYSDKNIDELLMRRHISAKKRRSSKRVTYIKPRTVEDDINFRICLEKLIITVLEKSHL